MSVPHVSAEISLVEKREDQNGSLFMKGLMRLLLRTWIVRREGREDLEGWRGHASSPPHPTGGIEYGSLLKKN